jgi:rhamnogalacturonan endolyase
VRNWPIRSFSPRIVCILLLLCCCAVRAGDLSCTIDGRPAKAGTFNPADIKSLVISSGNLSITFAQDPTGEFGPLSIQNAGQELAPPDGLSAISLVYSGGRARLMADSVNLITVTPKFIHLALVDRGTHAPYYLEHHLVMVAGLDGIYGYVVVKSRPGAAGDMRVVYQFDREILSHTYTGGPQNDDYSVEISVTKTWGHFGNGCGAFFMPISTEYYPGGPLQRFVILSPGAIFNPISASGAITPPAGRKLFGPWLLYFNTGDTPQAITDDARQREVEEAGNGPYPWLHDPQYPPQRTNVAGQLIIPGQQPNITTGRTAAGAWVILAHPEGNISHQSGGYISYTHADDAGDFWLPDVRPGHYTLYVWPGQGIITRELVKDDIEIQGDAQNLGQIDWDVPTHANLIFQIGKSNRSADEFKFGNQPRNAKWLQMVPADMTFTIGQSNDSRDWYFAQSKAGHWIVKFNLTAVPTGQAYLSIPIVAAGPNAHVTVTVNRNNVLTIAPNANDGYQLEQTAFPASILTVGQNTMDFNMTDAGKSGVSYDTVILESD